MGRILLIATIIACILLVAIFQVTTPGDIGPIGILSVFILLYIVTLGVVTFLIFGLSIFLRKSINLFIAAKKPMQSLTLTHSYYFASVISLGPIMLLGIHSVGELGFYDALLVIIFVIISLIYVAKRAR